MSKRYRMLKKSHLNLLAFKINVLNTFLSKKSCFDARLVFIWYFLLIHFTF